MKEQGSVMMSFGGVSTATFFEGVAPISYLRQRVAAIVAANPWVTSMLARDQSRGVLHLEPHCETAEFITVIHGGEDLWTGCLGDSVSWLMNTHCVGTGHQSLDKAEVLFKVIVFVEDERFVLVTSMSHMLADGHTYYEVHNMLAPSAAVRSLNRQLVDIADAEAEALGWEETAVLGTDACTDGMARNAMKGYPRPLFFEINTTAVAAAKAELKVGEVPFVSTNDVLTAAFFASSAPHLGMMAVDLRPRLGGLDDDSAGNYENAVYYTVDDYSPECIRKSLTAGRIRRVSTCALPVDHLIDGRISLVTNWSTFARKQTMGFEGCELVTHLPVQNAEGFRDYAVIFQLRPGVLGVVCRGTGVCESEGLLRASEMGNLLGSEISVVAEQGQ